jgi:hypothetical protein
MPTETVWKKSWKKDLELSEGPLKLSETVSVRFSLLNSEGQYLVEIDLLGKSKQYPLGDKCYPVTTFGHLLSLEVCSRKLVFAPDGVTPQSLDLSIRACIGKWGLRKCEDLYDETVRLDTNSLKPA